MDQSQLIAKIFLERIWNTNQYLGFGLISMMKLQIGGSGTTGQIIVSRINKELSLVSNWYYKDDTFVAVDAINDSRAYMVGKRFLEAGKSPNKLKLLNSEIDLKDLNSMRVIGGTLKGRRLSTIKAMETWALFALRPTVLEKLI